MSAERLTIDVAGGRLYGSRWSGKPDGPPLVLLHAGVADRRVWDYSAPGITGFGDVIAYDRRGFGETPPATGDFRHLDDLWAVLDAATDRPVWLVGNSKGGGLALDAALERPDRVAGLVLIAPAVSGIPDEGELDEGTVALEAGMKEAAAVGDLATINRLETWLWLDGPTSSEQRVTGPARELALSMNAVVLANDVPDDAGDSGFEAWPRLGEIKLPTTIAWGDLDVPVLIDECERTAARIPGARRVALPGVAHLPHLEQPECLAELVGQALA